MAARYDSIVIGGGIVGATAAFFLARAGEKVLLVDRNDLATGTTDNSFAWINATSKTADHAYHNLNALGRLGYLDLANEFGEEVLGINPCGALRVVERSDDANYAVVRRQFEQLQDWDYPSAWLDRSNIAAMEPHLDLAADTEALYAPGDMSLKAPQFTRAMCDALVSHGGEVLTGCAAKEITTDTDGVVNGLVTDKADFACQKILLAVGRATGDVLSDLTGYQAFANRFPMQQVPGLLLTTAKTAPRKLINRVVYFATGGDFHALPDFSGGIKIGADDTDGMVEADHDPYDYQEPARILLDRLIQRIPALASMPDSQAFNLRIGVRPYPNDGMSIAGAFPGAEGLYLAVTHSGVTLAPALANLMTELMQTGKTPAALKPFALDRYPGFGA